MAVGTTTRTLGMTRVGSLLVEGAEGVVNGKVSYDATIYGSVSVAWSLSPSNN